MVFPGEIVGRLADGRVGTSDLHVFACINVWGFLPLGRHWFLRDEFLISCQVACIWRAGKSIGISMFSMKTFTASYYFIYLFLSFFLPLRWILFFYYSLILLFFKKNFKCLKKILVFIFERERERENEQGEGRERGRHRMWSRLQALSCGHRARRGAWTHKLRSWPEPKLEA